MTRHRIAVGLLATLGVALATAGCFGGKRAPKGPGVAVWVAPGSAPLDATLASRLTDAGVAEYFVESAELHWEAGHARLHLLQAPRPPRRVPATLVITGAWPSTDVDAKAAAAELAQGIQGLRLGAEQQGWLPVGVHFDLAVPGSLERYGDTLYELRDKMDDRLYLSATLPRRDLARGGLDRFVEPLDFVVSFVYGQRPNEPEDPTAWDLQSVEGTVHSLEKLERAYYLGAVTVGTATLRDAKGATRATSTELDLGTLVWQPRFELKRGFTLEGIDRQVYEFRARSPVTVGPWSLATGESVRVVRAATTNMEEFRRRCGAWQASHLLGEVFWRLPAENEKLSMDAANLVDALSSEPSRPGLEILVERTAARGREWRLQVSLIDHNDEDTDVSYLDSNYLDLWVEGARIADVAAGDFARFELSYHGERGTMQALRQADRVRLFAPIVEGRQQLTTGPVVLELAGRDAVIRTSGNFLLTDGQFLTLETREWSFGSEKK
jgi:hypothetical protein